MHLHLKWRQNSVQLSSECETRGKSSSSAKVVALVKPFPSLPWRSQCNLSLQHAGCLSKALCCGELISSCSPPPSQAGVMSLPPMPGVPAEAIAMLWATAFGHWPAEPLAGVAFLKTIWVSLGKPSGLGEPMWQFRTGGMTPLRPQSHGGVTF